MNITLLMNLSKIIFWIKLIIGIILNPEVKYLKETYVSKSELKVIEIDLKKIKEKLKTHDNQIEESKL